MKSTLGVRTKHGTHTHRCCSCCFVQSEVSVHCFGAPGETRSHASFGSMQPAPGLALCSADGGHGGGSCPQVLHSQSSAPVGQLAAAAAAAAVASSSNYQPSPLGQTAPRKQASLPPQRSKLQVPCSGGVPPSAAQQQQQQYIPAAYAVTETAMDTDEQQ
jgi:hypothetical protein